MVAKHTPFDFVNIAHNIFTVCQRRLESIGYQGDGKKVEYRLHPVFEPNACAIAQSHEQIHHVIQINEGLLSIMHRVCNAFSETKLNSEASQVMNARHAWSQIMFKTGNQDANTTIYRFAMVFVFFHEAGHLNQQHKKFRDSLQIIASDIPFDELDEGSESGKEEIKGIESVVRQTMELMADYEGMIRTLEFVKALSIDSNGNSVRDTRAHIWLAVVGICLVFYVFQGRKVARALMPVHGKHPRPGARMLMIARWISDYIGRNPEHFSELSNEDYRAEFIEEAIISASQFWYTYASTAQTGAKLDELPVMHTEMKLSADFQVWQREISIAWQLMVKVFNDQRICKGVPLPEFEFYFTS